MATPRGRVGGLEAYIEATKERMKQIATESLGDAIIKNR